MSILECTVLLDRLERERLDVLIETQDCEGHELVDLRFYDAQMEKIREKIRRG